MKPPPKKSQTKDGLIPDHQGDGAYSVRHPWLMRLAAASLVPLLLLGLLELGLRLIGYGYSTSFYEHSQIDGEDYLIPNREFTHQFFPPALARAPLPSRMLANKPEGVYRIFLFGESAAYGDPDPSFGMGRFLEALLELRYPAADFEVVCVAITAINSHVILPIVRDCARHDGDMWVIYMGNNEMVGPYGASTVFGSKAPNLTSVRGSLALKSTRLGQLMDSLITNLRGGSSVPEAWNGIEMFRNNQLRHDDAGRLKAYRNFEKNLDDILELGDELGVPVILSTVASNLRDCSPFASLHSTGLDEALLTEWDRLFEKGKTLEEMSSFEEALNAYAEAAAIDPEYAELQFRMGTCHLALGDNEQALGTFERARDLDALVVRADSRINQIIKDAISRYEGKGVMGIDPVTTLANGISDGISGKELFYEHVHFTLEGNYRLARSLAERVAEQLPDSIAEVEVKMDPESELKACNEQLAVTVWDQKRVWDVALGRISVEPFTSQSSHSHNVRYCNERMSEVDSRTTGATPIQDRLMYERAIYKEPDDTQIRWNFAQFLERTGCLSEAIVQGKLICERLPHAPWPHYFVGSVLAKEKRFTEAVGFLQQALNIDGDLTHAQNELERIESIHPGLVDHGN